MKKPNKKGATAAKIVAGIAATLLMGSNINGCVYGPPLNINGDVYGPPPTDETEPSPFVTVKVNVSPLSSVIVYVSITPLVPVFSMLSILEPFVTVSVLKLPSS